MNLPVCQGYCGTVGTVKSIILAMHQKTNKLYERECTPYTLSISKIPTKQSVSLWMFEAWGWVSYYPSPQGSSWGSAFLGFSQCDGCTKYCLVWSMQWGSFHFWPRPETYRPKAWPAPGNVRLLISHAFEPGSNNHWSPIMWMSCGCHVIISIVQNGGLRVCARAGHHQGILRSGTH